MNKLKRFLAAVLAAVMIVSLGSGFVCKDVQAAEGAVIPTGSITVNNAADGVTYDAYRIFNVSKSGDEMVYSVNESWTMFFKSLYGKRYIVDPGSTEKQFKEVMIDGKKRFINISSHNVHDFANDAHVYASKLAEADASAVAAYGTATLSELPLGYYLVYQRDASQVQGEGNDALCHLTAAEPNYVIDSNGSKPIITKTVDDEDKLVEIGQVVTFTVTGEVPNTAEYKEYIFEIQDIMAGLELTGEYSVKIGTENKDITEAAKQGRTRMLPSKGAKNFGLQLDMRDYQDYVGQPVSISYQAVVTEQAEGTYTNSATLDYSNNPKGGAQTVQTPAQVVTLNSYDIEVVKTDADQSAPFPLAGAEFVLYRHNDGNTEYYQYAAGENGKPKVSWVALEDGETVEQALSEKKISKVITGRDGKAIFKGVVEGDYAVKELKAPENYALQTEDQTFNVSKAAEKDYIVTVDVKASKISDSEEGKGASGIGIGVYLVVGFACLLVLLLLTRKKHTK